MPHHSLAAPCPRTRGECTGVPPQGPAVGTFESNVAHPLPTHTTLTLQRSTQVASKTLSMLQRQCSTLLTKIQVVVAACYCSTFVRMPPEGRPAFWGPHTASAQTMTLGWHACPLYKLPVLRCWAVHSKQQTPCTTHPHTRTHPSHSPINPPSHQVSAMHKSALIAVALLGMCLAVSLAAADTASSDGAVQPDT